MGLDIYAGPVCRYVAGDWMTVIQAAGLAEGIPVQIVRANEPAGAIRDIQVVTDAVTGWRDGLLSSLGVVEPWEEDPKAEYLTDKPDWDGYGAVVLLAAYDERPTLAPGSIVRRGLRRSEVRAVSPRSFSDAPAFKAATRSAERYVTFLLGAEWCLPLPSGPRIFPAATPNGRQTTMGRVDVLLEELNTLNQRTLQLGPDDMDAARRAGPPQPPASVEEVAPFGLSVLLGLAEFADEHRVAWIMDY